MLADARLPADRAQPPSQRHGSHRRVRRRASRATTRRSRRRTASSPRSSCATATRRSRSASGTSHPPARDDAGRARATAGRSVAGSSASTGSSAARPTSTTPISSTTTTRSIRRARPRRATTSPRTWPTRPISTSTTCAPRRRRSRSSSGSRRAPATRRTRSPRRVHRRVPGRSSTRVGTRGAKRCSRRQMATGLLPAGTELSERPHWIPAWDSLTDDERRLYARMMEVYAGFLEHTDAQVGRVLDFIDELGELDNTIVVVMSDNGAVGRGRSAWVVQREVLLQLVPESLEENLRAHRRSRHARRAQPLPVGLGVGGQHAAQAVEARDARRRRRRSADRALAGRARAAGRDAPSVRACDRRDADAPRRDRHRRARRRSPACEQQPIDGVSFAAHVRRRRRARAATSRSTTRCSAAGRIYHDGWKAVAFHPLMLASPTTAATRAGRSTRTSGSCTTSPRTSPRPSTSPTQEPERLAAMIDLWWAEAERNQVLPLTNQPGRHGDRRYPARALRVLRRHRLLPDAVAPNLRNRGYRMTAELDVPESAVTACIVSHGGARRRLRDLRPGPPPPLRRQLPRRADHHHFERRAAPSPGRARSS